MREWPVDPELDRRLEGYLEAERARTRRDLADGASSTPNASLRAPAVRRSRGGKGAISISMALLAAIAIVAAVLLRGTASNATVGGDASPSAGDVSPVVGDGSPSASVSSASTPAASQLETASAVPTEDSSGPSATVVETPPKGWANATPTPSGAVSGSLRTIGKPNLDGGIGVTLGDGRVLLAGNGAEVFDPSNATFTVLDRATHPGGTATLLADGRVLLAGGTDAAGKESTAAQLFDPSTRKFTSTGPLTAPRSGHTATLLADGRVLIAGGDIQHTSGEGRFGQPQASSRARLGATSEAIATTEIWDPKTGHSTRSGDLVQARPYPAATRLADGRVLFAGGGDEGNMATATAEIFDPISGKSTPTGEMAAAMRGPVGVRLSDGRVLIAGGADDQGRPVPVEIFDPSTARFSVAGTIDRGGYAVAALQGDRILALGGSIWGGDSFSGVTTGCLVFDAKTGSTAAAPSIPNLAFVSQAIPLKDGRVLLLESTSEQLLPAQIYTP